MIEKGQVKRETEEKEGGMKRGKIINFRIS